MKALISIDYTFDFIDDKGKLTTGAAGQAIEPAMVNHARQFIHHGDVVVFAIDEHDPLDRFHPENALFPAHNVCGTPGRQLYGRLATLYEQHQHKEHVWWLNKRRYSAFCGTNLDIRLRERAITAIYLTGVCTDICVLHTAIDAWNLGYKIYIYQDAVAGVDPAGQAWALNHFKRVLGATIIG